jgi:hypothetical protein
MPRPDGETTYPIQNVPVSLVVRDMYELQFREHTEVATGDVFLQ